MIWIFMVYWVIATISMWNIGDGTDDVDLIICLALGWILLPVFFISGLGKNFK